MGESSFGALLKIGDGAPTEAFTTIAEVLDIKGPTLTAETEETTNHSSTGGWDEHIATILRGGDVTFDVNFNPAGATHDYSSGLLKDMTDRTVRNFTLTFPDAAATVWAFAAIITKFEPGLAVVGKILGSVVLKISGQPTLA